MTIPPQPGSITGGVRTLVRLESFAILALATSIYWHSHDSWLLFAILFFAPDAAFLGYLAGPRVGALVYNTLHSYIGPITLLALSSFNPRLTAFALIWLAHIGFDRALGYGLRYQTAFTATHLGNIGRPKST